jgi:hypothetical protein
MLEFFEVLRNFDAAGMMLVQLVVCVKVIGG